MSNLTNLKLIESIVREGNLTAASESLFVSQPYLSKMVKRIEEDIGVSIFERLPRGMKLTYAGSRYLEYLKRIEEIEQEALNEMYLIANNKKGTIKIGVNPALGISLLPLILPSFISDFPEVKVEIYEESAETIEKLLEHNEIDVGLAMMNLRSPSLTYEYLYEDNMYLIVNSNGPLYNADFKGITSFPYDLSALNDLPLVLVKPEMGFRRLVDDFFAKNRLQQNVLMDMKTVYTAVGLVRKGLGNTLVPTTGMSWIDFSNCNIFKFNTDIFTCNYAVFYNSNRMLPKNVLAFIEYAKSLDQLSKLFRINGTRPKAD